MKKKIADMINAIVKINTGTAWTMRKEEKVDGTNANRKQRRVSKSIIKKPTK